MQGHWRTETTRLHLVVRPALARFAAGNVLGGAAFAASVAAAAGVTAIVGGAGGGSCVPLTGRARRAETAVTAPVTSVPVTF